MPCFCFSSGKETTSSPKRRVDEEVLDVSGVDNIKFFSYNEVRNATSNFNPANKIGEGGYGSVYKGVLKDGTVVAMKVLSPESRQGFKEFLTELVVIAGTEHENLVKLHGCCVEEGNRILVYGYLENNSLTKSLLGESHNTIDFSWRIRRNIAIGVAKGLAYLHEEVRPHIIHRDIKASNILLDRDLNAKISDFGLAKLIPVNMTHVSTKVAGTLGYLAPEYAIRGKLTRRADIYSFGILLLEIVCGRQSRNKHLPPQYQYLVDRAWRLYESGDLIDLVDESFRGDVNAEEACRFMKVALLCAQDMPMKRPLMSTVVKMLQGEEPIDEQKLSKPGLLNDLSRVKVQEKKDDKIDLKCSSAALSSSTQNPDTQSSSLTTVPSCATVTITAISDRTR
ncbi:Cold-responsive protein kinase 1-like protein [Drosera capensis]